MDEVVSLAGVVAANQEMLLHWMCVRARVRASVERQVEWKILGGN